MRPLRLVARPWAAFGCVHGLVRCAASFLDALSAFGAPRRLPPNVSDEALFGGVDVAASLGTGTLVQTRGLLDSQGLLVLPMAERASPALGARLAGGA